MNEQVMVSREELYALVWREPLSRLSERYGMSAYALRKICERLAVPVPRGGYWNRVRVGKGEPLAPLPRHYGGERSVMLGGKGEQPEVEDEVFREPLVMELRKGLLARMKERYGIMDGLIRLDEGLLDVRVSPALVDRACRFMDSLLWRLRERGYVLVIRKGLTKVVIADQEIQVVCREKRRRVPALERGAWPRSELHPTGVLALQVAERLREREWLDGMTSMERQIPAIIEKLEVLARDIAEEKRIWALRREEQEAAERGRLERERRREKERADFRALLQAAERWRQAALIRQYAEAMETEALAQGDKATDIRDWVAWARGKADWYDPRVEGPDEWLENVDRDTLAFKKPS